MTNRRIVLARRPVGEPVTDDFRLETGPVPQPGAGEVLLRTRLLSLDPYMRGRISSVKSYARGVEVGETMVGGTVGEVVASNDADWTPGDLVLAASGWQDYAVAKGKALVRVPRAEGVPLSAALGVLGMPGMTAYTGLREIGRPKPGETVVVAAASGAVGSVVGQVAKIMGCRTVGIAGGPDKVAYVKDVLGFDVAVDHRAPDLPARLAEACPGGIDVYFENVGGAVWDAVFPLLNFFARIPVCGLIAQYNAVDAPDGPDRLAGLMRQVLTKRLTLRGFIVSDFAALKPDFDRDMPQWVREGRVKYREDVVDGLENAPAAFIGLLRGANFGKLVVRVA